jgi:hypothetical protein
MEWKKRSFLVQLEEKALFLNKIRETRGAGRCKGENKSDELEGYCKRTLSERTEAKEG